MKSEDAVTVSTVVAASPNEAFRIFTEEVDLWWRRGPRYRFREDRDGRLRFEPGPTGRLVEAYDDGGSHEVGRVLAWEPGARLVFEWRGRGFAPGERTEVEVRFDAAARGTRVTVEHRGWDSLPAGHPARHGLRGGAFVDAIGLFWADLLVPLRAAFPLRP